MKILLIEDDSVVARGIQDILQYEFAGVSTDYAVDFNDAADFLEENSYDILISDLHMPSRGIKYIVDSSIPVPTLNGWKFLKYKILQEGAQFSDKCKDTKIILFSAYLEQLSEFLSQNPIDKEFLSKIRKVDKGHIYYEKGGYQMLIEVIRSILN